MAVISFTISAQNITRLETAVCDMHGYEGNKLEGETQTQFTRRMIEKLIKQEVRNYEHWQAVQTSQAAITDITIS